jgi:hypothetical protein
MFDATAFLASVQSHAMTLGLFEKVNGHEPKNAPGHGLTAAIWAQRIDPVPAASGLAATAGRIELNVRIFTNMMREPQDAIDPEMATATIALMGAYSADFDLGVTDVREVDLLGEYGTPLSAQAGYLTQDGKLYRVMTITLPVIVNDLWSQSA